MDSCRPIEYWLLPLSPMPRSVRASIQVVSWIIRRAGLRFPKATRCEINAPETMVSVFTEARAWHGRVLVNCATSAAVRTANAARERGVSLEGATFDIRSEPLTEARRQDIEAAGARVIASYGSNEITFVAAGCASRRVADDMHLYAHEYALITRPRDIDARSEPLQGLHVSTLSPLAPVIGLNTEMGDVATVDQQGPDCCRLGQPGLTTHLSNVRSFDKLARSSSFATSRWSRRPAKCCRSTGTAAPDRQPDGAGRPGPVRAGRTLTSSTQRSRSAGSSQARQAPAPCSMTTITGAQVSHAPLHARATFDFGDLPSTSVTRMLSRARSPSPSTRTTSPAIRVPRRST